LGYFFLITYHQSLISIHSSCSFIPAILTILRLDFGQFFFNNLTPPRFIHSIIANKHNALCRLLRRHFPYVTHNAPIYHRLGLLFRSPPYCGPLLCTRSEVIQVMYHFFFVFLDILHLPATISQGLFGASFTRELFTSATYKFLLAWNLTLPGVALILIVE